MIISHKYKYIFIKPMKVAGTSIEVALARHRTSNDIITPITEYSETSDDNSYFHPPQNHEGFYNHIPPEEIKSKIGKNIWENYFKFTIIRNPWDQVVSQYFWKKYNLRNDLQDSWSSSNKIRWIKDCIYYFKYDFNYFVKNFKTKWINTKYYFDKKGEPICDYYIRYETLDTDYKHVCKKLGITYEELPRLKSKQRKNKNEYSKFYTQETKQIVENMFLREIKYFDYKFNGN